MAKGLTPITGYVSIWKGIVCQLPLHPVRGEWHSSAYNQQEVITGTYKGKPTAFNVIHYQTLDEYGNDLYPQTA